MIFTCTIPGRPIVKKNTKRFYSKGKKKFVVYSSKFIEWEKQALYSCIISKLKETINFPVEASFKFYFKNKQGEADTSNLVEGIADVLTKAKIIKDDKLIMKFTAEKIFDETPRTEVEIWTYENQSNT